MENQDHTQEARAARAAARQALEAAMAAIEAIPDARNAFAEASGFAEDLRDANGDVADLRGRMAARIADDERMTLVELASHLGVSKQRASKMVQNTRKPLEGREGELSSGDS